MNQVMELLRLTPGATLQDAVTRLSTLFDLMTPAPGFRDSEVLKRVGAPDTLLVLHAWDDMDSWVNFRTSETKLAFAVSRPDFLYTFIPCGINWLAEAGEHSQEGDYLRRELIEGSIEPRRDSPDVLSSLVLSYRDYEPTLQGVSLRLTRLLGAPATPASTNDSVFADEMYESLKKHSVMPVQTQTAVGSLLS